MRHVCCVRGQPADWFVCVVRAANLRRIACSVRAQVIRGNSIVQMECLDAVVI